MLFPIKTNLDYDSLTNHFSLYGVTEEKLAISYNDAELRLLAYAFLDFTPKRKFHFLQKFSLITHQKTFSDFLDKLNEEDLLDSSWNC